MAVYGIDHVQVSMPAGGEQLARNFYGELLGLTELPKPPNLAGFEVKYDSEPVHGCDRAFTSDPFGNRIELIQPHAKPLQG